MSCLIGREVLRLVAGGRGSSGGWLSGRGMYPRTYLRLVLAKAIVSDMLVGLYIANSLYIVGFTPQIK